MTTLAGKKYVYQINPDQILLIPRVDNIHQVELIPYPDEDFSLLDFGPEICKEIEIGVESASIDNVGEFTDLRMRIWQPDPGNNIEIMLFDLQLNTVIDITDTLLKYNRGGHDTEKITDYYRIHHDPIIPIKIDPYDPDYWEKEHEDDPDEPGGDDPDDPTEKYSNIKIMSAATISGNTFESRTSDENTIMVDTDAPVHLIKEIARKYGATLSEDEYLTKGVNAAILCRGGGNTYLTECKITASGDGAHGVFSCGTINSEGDSDETTVYVQDCNITTTKPRSNGLMVVGNGNIFGSDNTIIVNGSESSALVTGQAGGSITIEGGTYLANGSHCHAVVSSDDIQVTGATLVSKKSETICVKGDGFVKLFNCVTTGSNTDTLVGSLYSKTILLYRTTVVTPGEHVEKTTLNVINGYIMNGNGAVFQVSNTTAVINLNNTTITNTDTEGILLRVVNDAWRGNDNIVTLNAKSQTLAGDIIVSSADSYISDANSGLAFNMESGTKFIGKIDDGLRGSNFSVAEVFIDKTSKWVLTDDSHISDITVEKGGKVITGQYKLWVGDELYEYGLDEDTDEEEPEPEEPDDDDPTADPVFTLDDTNYTLKGNKDHISAVKTGSGLITVKISGDGKYEFTGTGKNVIIKVDDNVASAALHFVDFNVNNRTLVAVSGEDLSTISAGYFSGVGIVLKGSNSIVGPVSFKDSPKPIIYGDHADIGITGPGSLTVVDGMDSNIEYNGEAPVDCISNLYGSLVFTQTGTVAFEANGSCIDMSYGTISFNGGTIEADLSYTGAIKANGGEISIDGSNITIVNTFTTGIEALKGEDGTLGEINVFDGKITISECYGDGIRAEKFALHGGRVDITTVYDDASTGYYTVGSTSEEYNTITAGAGTTTTRININPGSHKALNIGTEGSTKIFKDGAGTIVTTATGKLSIYDGTLVISTLGTGVITNNLVTNGYNKCDNGLYIVGAPDDAIFSHNEILITGGTTTIDAAKNGIICAGLMTIDNQPSITINNCYKGIVGATMLIGNEGSPTGPSIIIKSNRNGISTEAKTLVYTFDTHDEMTKFYTLVETLKTNNKLDVYSGTIGIDIDSDANKSIRIRNGSSLYYKSIIYKAEGNAIDISGLFVQHGGSITIYGQTENGEYSPISTVNGYSKYKDSVLFATGTDPLNKSKPISGNAVYLVFGTSSGKISDAAGSGFDTGDPMQLTNSSSYEADTSFRIATTDGAEIFAIELPHAGNFILYSSPELIKGNSYSVSVGGVSTRLKAQSPS